MLEGGKQTADTFDSPKAFHYSHEFVPGKTKVFQSRAAN